MPPRGRASDVNATAAALLGLLHDGPMTGGQLVAAAGERSARSSPSPAARSTGSCPRWPTAGLLKLGKQGPRASQQYVAHRGRAAAFKAWLTSGGGSDALRSPLVLRLLHAGSLTGEQRAELVAASREAFSARLASARAAARGEADPYRRAVADFAVAHNRAMVKLLDAIPLD